MRTAAILPVKRLQQSKQRLRASIDERLRVQLVQAMAEDVLSALAGCDAIERTIVVTSEPHMSRFAAAQGALVVPDTAEEGQSAAVALGVAQACACGYARALCVPGDCPTLDPDELSELLDEDGTRATAARRPPPRAVIVPDRHDTGTNGLLLSPPDAISPSFGPGSCARHRALADAGGVVWRLRRPPSLLLDVDTGDDLDVLRARLAGSAPRAACTRVALGAGCDTAPHAVTA
ncbi:MAG TPA: 2-phospho-L-lactate guanylyltransferase [Solirubrobacteraceae bacterium]|nr:2-phospho-L-lactate guanylyltransferase [Solirubrobacteraceae bacterium]